MTKVCTKCGVEKEVSEFHRKACTSDGYRGVCKKCRKQQDGVSKKYQPCFTVEKICTKCGERKDATAFSVDSKRKDGLRSYCKLCGNKITRQWKNNNKEKNYSITKLWKQNNKARTRSSVKKWQTKNKIKVKGYIAKWESKNQDKKRLYSAKHAKKYPEKIHNYNIKIVNTLADSYIRQKAKNQGYTTEMIAADPYLIPLLRAQIKLKRKLKSTNNGKEN